MPDLSTMLETGSLILNNQIFRLIVESARDCAIFTTDDEGHVTTWNVGAERVLGFKEWEILGKSIRIIFTPEDNQHGRPDAEMREALEIGRADDQCWHVCKDGRRIWADGLIMPLRNDAEHLLGFVKIILDRTAEKRASMARRQAEADLRLMIESARDFAIFTFTPDNLVASWNSGAERMFGYQDAEIIGKHGAILFVPEDQAAGMPMRELETAKVKGRAEDERWHQRKDGSRFFASGVCSPIYDEAGKHVGFTKIARDITERKQAADEFARQAEENRVQAKLLELSHVLIRDLEGRILFWNRGTQALYGWSKEEAIGQVCHQLLKARYSESLEHISRQLVDEGRWQGEVGHTCKDGRDIIVFSVVTLHEGEQGRLALESNTDITKQKELERSLRDQARELADADERKNEFLAMLAHELRNPLAVIYNSIRLAQRLGAVKDLSEVHEIIARQTTTLSRLIDDLLDVSRIAQGLVELKKEPVELAAIIYRAAEAVEPLIRRRGHELSLQLAASPIRLNADPTRLEQIIGNLLTNAAKYSENGGRITVSTARARNEAVIEVRDTGVGIPPEMLPKIFDLFTQVDRSLARTEGGLGIGLTLVKKLVELHGGAITVTSEVGRGSEFTIRLPLLGAAPEQTTPKQGREVGGAGKKVLVVDDNLDAAQLSGWLLESAGFEVRIGHDGKTAIELASAIRPEVILLDIGLPVMDGFAVARRLRQEDCCRDTLIIGITGYGDQKAREQARQAGFDHLLVKPVDIAAVTELIASGKPREACDRLA